MNKRRSKVIGLLAIVVILLIACGFVAIRGSGNLVTESRSVSDFDRVDLGGSGEVVITQSGEESLTVETDDNIMQYVSTKVRGGTLYLGFDTIRIRGISPTRLRFTLNVKDLAGLDISGSGTATSTSIETDRLDVRVSGSGDVRIDSLTAEEVEVRISGSGEAELAGEVTGQDIHISGSGDYHAEDLRSETVTVRLSGSGNATVWATGSLDARLSGSSSVNYYGNPTTNVSSSGSGKINGLGEK